MTNRTTTPTTDISTAPLARWLHQCILDFDRTDTTCEECDCADDTTPAWMLDECDCDCHI